jgi:hypothetical protein
VELALAGGISANMRVNYDSKPYPPNVGQVMAMFKPNDPSKE